MRSLYKFIPAVLFTLAACGSQVVLFPDDAGTAIDGSADSGGSDAKNDTCPDALTDTAIETSMDAPMEGMSDASMEADAPMETSLDGPGCNTPPGAVVNLGTAGHFAILAKSGISTVPASIITGDIGVSPISATAITGFSLTPCTGTCPFSTSTQVTGNVYAANYGTPTPTDMTTAIGDMQVAFTDAAGRAPGFTELGSGNIGAMTLAPGVYKWSTGLLIPTNVTLQGGCGDVWIFEVAQNLTVDNGVHVVLSGGALAKNVFWQVSGEAILGTTVEFQGTILSQTAITMNTSSYVVGGLLSQTAVTLNQDTVSLP